MKVILLKDVPTLGHKADIKNVSDGYALNFLFPQKLAELASAGAVKRIEAEKATAQAARTAHEKAIGDILQSVSGTFIALTEKANEKGHLFKAIHKTEILEAIKKAAGANDLTEELIVLEKPIKEVGDYAVELKGAGKQVKVKISIKADK
jgi:large subunit ribosomal protein L9